MLVYKYVNSHTVGKMRCKSYKRKSEKIFITDFEKYFDFCNYKPQHF